MESCKIYVPALDDEFAKDVSEFDTLEELEADIRAKALEQAEKRIASEKLCVEGRPCVSDSEGDGCSKGCKPEGRRRRDALYMYCGWKRKPSFL